MLHTISVSDVLTVRREAITSVLVSDSKSGRKIELRVDLSNPENERMYFAVLTPRPLLPTILDVWYYNNLNEAVEAYNNNE
jgi:hypothetical protein